MIKQQKRLFLILAALFVLLLIVYFAVVRPLLVVEEAQRGPGELLEGEVPYNDRVSNFYIYQPMDRSAIQSIQVENEHGGYTIYRDATDTFQMEGYAGLSFNDELFASLVVTTGRPMAVSRIGVDLSEEELAVYGFDNPIASWTVTATSGKKYTTYVGSNLLTDGGYYVKFADRNAVYAFDNTLANTILKPAFTLLKPILTAGLDQSNYLFVDQFRIFRGEDLYVQIDRVPENQMKNPDDLVEAKLSYPTPEDGDRLYPLNDNYYYNALYFLINLSGESVVAFKPTDEELDKYGLLNPAYSLHYKFGNYTVYLMASEQQPDGSFYAVSNLYGYTVVCSVSGDLLGWIAEDTFAWIDHAPFFEFITDVARITLNGSGVDVDFRLSHSVDSAGKAVLNVEEVKSGLKIPNEEVRNFRYFYTTLLNITNREYATMSQEDRAALLGMEDKIILKMTVTGNDGTKNEYQFYQYYEESADKISGGKVFVSINGIAEFYTTNDLIQKIINDVPRLLDGLDISAYAPN